VRLLGLTRPSAVGQWYNWADTTCCGLLRPLAAVTFNPGISPRGLVRTLTSRPRHCPAPRHSDLAQPEADTFPNDALVDRFAREIRKSNP
jgi:hypothetical protein